VRNKSSSCSIARLLASAAGLATASYAVYAGITWCHYGPPGRPGSALEADTLLDRFMPVYEAAERHHRRVAAPAEVALAAACELDLKQSMIVQSLFKTRAWVLGSKSEGASEARDLLGQVESLGWRVLAEIPGREIVVGAVTRPWMADVVFQGVPPEEFAAFDQPGFVKVAWTLRADPIGSSEAVIRTETRVTTTDSIARRKFRNYWSLIHRVVLIRLVLVNMVKREAERGARGSLLAFGCDRHLDRTALKVENRSNRS
jgi:hypothetical protein